MTQQDAFHGSKILILDFGSQYTQVIARRIRECQVYSQIVKFDTPASEIGKLGARGIILVGRAGECLRKKRAADRPRHLQARPAQCSASATACSSWAFISAERWSTPTAREYGAGLLHVKKSCELFHGLPETLDVWNSHGDKLTKLPNGFRRCRQDGQLADFAAIADGEAQFLRTPVSPRSRAHAAREGDSGELRLQHLRLQNGLDDGLVHRADVRGNPRAGRRRSRRARPERRRGFQRGGRASAQGDRRPAHLHLRQQRPAAPQRGRGRPACLRRKLPRQTEIRRCDEAFPDQTQRRDRSRAEAQDHRQRIHPRL